MKSCLTPLATKSVLSILVSVSILIAGCGGPEPTKKSVTKTVAGIFEWDLGRGGDPIYTAHPLVTMVYDMQALVQGAEGIWTDDWDGADSEDRSVPLRFKIPNAGAMKADWPSSLTDPKYADFYCKSSDAYDKAIEAAVLGINVAWIKVDRCSLASANGVASIGNSSLVLFQHSGTGCFPDATRHKLALTEGTGVASSTLAHELGHCGGCVHGEDSGEPIISKKNPTIISIMKKQPGLNEVRKFCSMKEAELMQKVK